MQARPECLAAAAAAAGMAAAATLRGGAANPSPLAEEEDGEEEEEEQWQSGCDGDVSDVPNAYLLPQTARYSTVRPSCSAALMTPRPSVAPPRTPPMSSSVSPRRLWRVSPWDDPAPPRAPPLSRRSQYTCEGNDQVIGQPHPLAHPLPRVRAPKANIPIGALPPRVGRSQGCRLCRECWCYTYLRKGVCENTDCRLAQQ